jgi:beta-phosphoglucomutase-like phosphatase (HAD superfamily)
MIVLFDLDNTLIHTERIKTDVFFVVAQSYGLSLEEAKELYRSVRNENGRVVLSPQSFAQGLSIKVEVEQNLIEENMYALLHEKMQEFCVDGAIDFVYIASQTGFGMYIVSLGVHSWQEDKIEAAGFGTYFPKEKRILPRLDLDEKNAKAIALQEFFGERIMGERSILINDKPAETAQLLQTFPLMRALVRWDGEDERYAQSDFETCHAQFKDRFIYSQSLRELQHIFQTNIISSL